MELVVDAKGGKDVELIFGVLVGDDDGVGFEDGVGGIDDGAGDGEIGRLVRSEAENESENDTEKAGMPREPAPAGCVGRVGQT